MCNVVEDQKVYVTPLSPKELKPRGCDNEKLAKFRKAYKKILVPLSLHGWACGNPCSSLSRSPLHRIIYYSYPAFVAMTMLLGVYFFLVSLYEDWVKELTGPRQLFKLFMLFLYTANTLYLISSLREWARRFSDNSLFLIIR